MSAPNITLKTEIDTLNDMETVARSTFQHCSNIIEDILRYSSDSSADLNRLKIHMNSISQSQTEIAGLIYATNEISNLTHLTEEEVTAKFQNALDEYIEENGIDDCQEDILFSLGGFTDGEEQMSGSLKEDNDLLVTKASLIYKDPLTQRVMQDPVKSKLCKHSYERESIMAYLADTKKKCPYSGCQSKLSRKDMVDDFVLKLKLSVEKKEC